MKFLTQRVNQLELMDDPNISFAEFQQTLSQIESINQRLGAYHPTLKALEKFILPTPLAQPIRILDIGFGNGDFLRRIHKWAAQHGIAVVLNGVDLNPWAAKAANLVTPAAMNIHYFTNNIFNFKTAEPFDIIINSLFTHHLTNTELVRVLQWMTANARLGWIINDLHRHTIPYHFIKYYVRAMRYNRLVRHDAPLSVARSFTRTDWQNLTQASGLNQNNIQISWMWPFRYRVIYAN